MSIKVAVVGAAGRMGQTICTAVEQARDMELVSQIDVGSHINADTLAGAEVAIEFTVPTVTESNVMALLDSGVDVVVGTSGWNEEMLARVEKKAKETGRSVIVAPNYGLSAVLLMHFSKLAARYFESAEVIEMHHPDKVDAPSGTAVSTAKVIGEARRSAGMGASPDNTQEDQGGSRGSTIDGVHVHAVRLRGLNAHEEVLFGNPAEQLVIRQDSFNRSSFMPGVLLAVRSVQGRGGLTYGLDKVMGL
jgi:dihydrodipicolinate reductase (EC 1.3.1.26)